jgi:DNA excision repair protein ERCC-6
MLDIIEKVFDGYVSFLRIDGQTAEKFRQRNVDHFNDLSSGIDCMLLSTKAAGVGITLNGANRAIIYDPSWNPAEDMQAIDRCYRIGQTRNVTVYRFITSGTVEEKMYEKQVHKDGIRRVLLTESIGGTTERYFDHAELRDLFKLAPPDAPCSMLTKFNGQSAVGSTGKQSFLTTHSRVVGVASHDLLYNNARGNKESSTVDLTSSTTDTPFSRQPFMSSAENKANNSVDCIQVDESPKCKPLGGGLSRTRQNREDAKAHHNEKALKETAVAAGSKGSMVASVIRRSEVLISKNEYAHAMDEMLGLLESENHLIQGNVKLKVHENISFLANKLGWL